MDSTLCLSVIIGPLNICRPHTQRIPGLCVGVWLYNHTVIWYIILKVVRMLWLITSVVLNVKVKLCWMGSFTIHVGSISLNCVICIMLNSIDDFFVKNSLCSYLSGLTV